MREGFDFPRSSQHLLLSDFVILFIQVRVKRCLTVVSLRIFLMTGDVEQLCMCLVAVCTSVEKRLLKSFARCVKKSGVYY